MASSPSASRDASPELLTPRAKLQALLRSVDSSDEENTNPSATKRKLSYKAGLPRRASASPTQSHTSDDDSDVEIRPRGRLAARMQGAAPPSSATSGSTSKIPESSLPETARERVRRMLMQEEKENEAGKGKASNDTTNEAYGEAEDDDEELPVTRRRLKRKSSVQPELASTQEETPVARSASPSLFVSPAKQSPSKASEHAEDSDNDLPTLKSDRFKALVQRKREEREAREAAEEARKAERRAQQEKLASEMEELDSDDGNVSSITDDEGGRQLTQKARPSRKASKKAIEDMNRETQRMQRNMQLAHEAKTRKKITKNSLFERFNFRPAGENEPKTTSSSRPGTPTSDTDMKDADTAPSSPPTARKDVTEDMIQQTPVQAGNELPSVDELALQTPTLDKGKGKAVDVEPQEELTVKPKRQVRVKMPAFVNHISLDDSDDELQVTRTTRDKVKAVFDSVPLNKAKESHSLQALRALAQVKSPGQETKRRSDHSGMTPAELQYNLQQRARQQARLERERRVEQLKAQGVVVQTAEEHEREKQEVENMLLAKAREEDRRLMQEERAAAKRKAREDGTADPLAWDDSEDEDYVERASKAGNDVDAEQSEVELSGSEEEREEEEEEDETEEDEGGNPMFANEADEEAENAASETAVVLTDPLAIDEEELPSMNRRRGRNLKAVLSDDEDDVVEATPKPQKITHQSPAVPATDSPAAPGSVLRSAKKTFIPGLPVESGGPAGLGLTQIFAGTMDDSQSQMTPARGPTQSMMPDFDHFPDSNFSAKSERLIDESTQNEDTQTSTQGVKFNMTQSQMRRLDSLLQGPDTQISEMIEPSQDGGFQEHTPLHDRFVEPPTSTIQTVLLDRTASVTQAADSPLVQRGRLRRKLDVIHEARDTESPSSATAFNALQDGAERQKKKEQQDDFNRKKSKAKEMVQEQADESEDEYAGLGGADGEDSDDESTASVQEMIDDEASNDADKAKIAAFYAERERMEDEQGMEKLYKDVTTGMLRRKRGMDYDLSDSDDGGEARRKMKRRQHAKMRQALYADERIEKIAKDPGNQAFLRTIEDQGSEDEMDIFDGTEEVEEEHSTATPPRNEVESQTVPDSQPRKALGDGGENPRAPAHLRRTKNGKKPADLGDVRKTLSNLLEDAEGSVIPATQAGSDSEEEEEEANEVRQASFRSDKENDAPNPRRGRVAVVDRISLKRNSSSNMSASRLAFATTDSTGSGIKVPVFLHRASSAAGSNLSSTSSSPSTTATGGGFGEEAKIKKPQGARGRSGIHGFGSARGAGAVAESEAMAKVRESERRRMEKRARGAERRMGAVGGLLGKGSFA